MTGNLPLGSLTGDLGNVTGTLTGASTDQPQG